MHLSDSKAFTCCLPGTYPAFDPDFPHRASVIAGWWKICLQCRRPWFDPWVGKIPWRRDRLRTPVFSGFPGGSAGKESPCSVGDLDSIPGLGRSPGRERLPTPVFWPGEFHGLYGPWGCKESDTTEWLSLSQTTIALFCLFNTILHPQSISPTILSVVPAFWVLYKWFWLILQILAQKSLSQRGFP